MIKREERQIISDNLKALLNQNKKKRTEVANDLNVKYSTFCDWVRARTAPDANQVKELANYFHVSVGEITNRNEDYNSISDAEILDSKVRITVFKTVECADGSIAYDTDYEYIDKYICGSRESIGFRLDDDSMEPVLQLSKDENIDVFYQPRMTDWVLAYYKDNLLFAHGDDISLHDNY